MLASSRQLFARVRYPVSVILRTMSTAKCPVTDPASVPNPLGEGKYIRCVPEGKRRKLITGLLAV
jgi:hypothetical protein